MYGPGDSRSAGRRLAQSIPALGRVHVLVLSEGVAINGSELVLGLTEFLPDGVSVSGRLSGDGALFERTVVMSDAPAQSGGLVRTILGVNEEEGSLTFAGDMPQGAYARLMRANFDRLIDGSKLAARRSVSLLTSAPQLVLKQRIEEEVEAVRDVLGEGPVVCGFYSYGEISPFTPGADCSLHNQTMTVTTLGEH